MKSRVRHIHMIGIGGSGMCGIAEVLLAHGYRVTGSDLVASEVTARLAAHGAQVFIGHAAQQITGADVVVVSSAVNEANPEVAAARQQAIPVIPRAVMLAELMRFKSGIAVAGTHGKTTTTSLIAHVLVEAGLDPTVVIGGRLNAIGSHAKAGRGEYLVAEADESDASFLHLTPLIAVVTNIDRDHMDTYGHDEARLAEAFASFIDRLPFYGLATVCIDDPAVRALLPRLRRRVRTVGFSEDAELRAMDVVPHGARMRFVARSRGPDGEDTTLAVDLNLAGRHNVLNAMAAIAVAREVGVADAVIASALGSFAGVGRRFQSYGEVACEGGRFTLIDDYGHHPREIEAVIAAARGAFPGRRVMVAFQPHRYTRTRDLFDEFAAVLAQADAVLLSAVYPAGEAPIVGASNKAPMTGATSEALAQAIARRAGRPIECLDTVAALERRIRAMARDRDVVLVMGAGSIAALAPSLAASPAECAADRRAPSDSKAITS